MFLLRAADMLYTVFSNSFEVLRESLAVNLAADNKKDTGFVFKDTTVVVPSQAAGDMLRRFFADRTGVCAGLSFKTLGQWFIKFGRPLIGLGEAGTELEFLIWDICHSDLPERHPRLKKFLDGKTPAERFEFAMHCAAVFSRYATYRLDWVLRWMGKPPRAHAENDPRYAAEEAALNRHPDYAWQKDMWRELARRVTDMPEARELNDLFEIEDRMVRAWHEKREERVHIFMPFTVPPLVLPLIKQMAEDAESDIYLYVLNPSSEYWYEALPQAAFDWDYGSEDNAVYQYLRRNAASSRAMIERVWTFLNLEGGADFVGMEPETKPDDPVAVTHTRHFFDPVTERLQDLKLESPQDADAYFVDPGKDTFLKALQRSVLTLKTAQGEMPDPADGSVIVGRAPSLIREVEILVDWLQYIFRTQKDVTPADVLVVTPDIEGAAGVIEAVMNAQPESRKIAWTIADDRVSDRAMALETWKALVELLFSRADASDLEAWLEMPQAQKRWQMTADDLALIHAWLVAGGYRFGFSEAHIERLVSEGEADAADTDGSLTRALERLTAGLFFGESRERVFGDVRPAPGAERRWESVLENEELFARLTEVAALLETKRAKLAAMGEAADPEVLKNFFVSLTTELTDFTEDEEAAQAIRGSLETAARALEATMKGRPVNPRVFAKAATTHVADALFHRTGNGLTFAGMKEFRGLPYKVIAVVGLNRDSAFPGTNTAEEFDLMAPGTSAGMRARRGDRDSRSDNRNIFLDLFLAARRFFYVSYAEGFERTQLKPPSVVQEDFLRFAAAASGIRDVAGQVTVPAALTPTGRANFVTGKLKRWKTVNTAAGDALNAACAVNFRGEVPRFADARSVLTPEQNTVTVNDIAQYFTKPSDFVLRKFGVVLPDAGEAETVPLSPSDDGLGRYQALNAVRGPIAQGVSPVRLAAAEALDPLNGAPGVREWIRRGMIEQTAAFYAQIRDMRIVQEFPEETVEIPADWGLTYLKKLVLPALTLYENPDGGEPLAVLVAVSGSEVRRKLIESAMMNAFGRTFSLRVMYVMKGNAPHDAIAPGYFGTIPGMETPVCDTIARSLLSLYECLFTSVTVVADNNENGFSGGDAILWRGYEGSERLAAAERFSKPLDYLFAPDLYVGKKDKKKRKGDIPILVTALKTYADALVAAVKNEAGDVSGESHGN